MSLNKVFVPIRVIRVRRAFAMLFKSAGEVLYKENGHFTSYDFDGWVRFSRERATQPEDHEEFIHTPNFPVMIPRVMRLYDYDKVPNRDVKFSRRNIIARDENRCQYCGRKFPTSKLTIDHIKPRCRGGKAAWTNVVACCPKCNTRKGDKRPQEVGMKLLRTPKAPRRNPIILDRIRDIRYGIWKFFVNEKQIR